MIDFPGDFLLLASRMGILKKRVYTRKHTEPNQRASLGFPGEGFVHRLLKATFIILALFFFLQMAFCPGLFAFTIIEKKTFNEGPFLFKLEFQVYGSGSAKKIPMRVNSVKVKIKNERASSKILDVKAVRAYRDGQLFQDIDTKGFPVGPGQWVTRYFRFPKDTRPLMGSEGFFQVVFEDFTITFSPRERKFLGPQR